MFTLKGHMVEENNIVDEKEKSYFLFFSEPRTLLLIEAEVNVHTPGGFNSETFLRTSKLNYDLDNHRAQKL